MKRLGAHFADKVVERVKSSRVFQGTGDNWALRDIRERTFRIKIFIYLHETSLKTGSIFLNFQIFTLRGLLHISPTISFR